MKVKISRPELPDGYEVSITGLNGILLNNQEVEIDQDAIDLYEAVTGKVFAETIKSTSLGGDTVIPNPDYTPPEDETVATLFKDETKVITSQTQELEHKDGDSA